MVDIVGQLVAIYYQYELWHDYIMDIEQAYTYHQKHLDNGDIYVHIEDNEVLGYYERFIKGNTCFLSNVYVKEGYRKGRVFRQLYKHFFSTMPKNIEYITGEKQKLGGKIMKEKIRR